jgi:hypothetical protein
MNPDNTDTTSDVLYHVLVGVINYHKDPSGATRNFDVFKTFTSIPAAKASARKCLEALGYLPADFDEYEEKVDAETWQHGDGVLVYAKAPAGQVIEVRVDTTPNVRDMKADNEAVVPGPLYCVLQTNIDYNVDRVGGKETTGVEAVFRTRQEAYEAAYKVLLDDAEGITKESFAEYDMRDEQKDDWPYGDDVLVHAVSENGENYLVTVKEQLNSH